MTDQLLEAVGKGLVAGFVGIVGYLIFYIINKVRENSSKIDKDTVSEPKSAESKTCPFCAETIKYEAIKCRYCQEMLDDVEVKTEYNAELAQRSKKGEIAISDNNTFSERAKRLISKGSNQRFFCIYEACPGFLDQEGYCKECGKDFLDKLKYNNDERFLCIDDACPGFLDQNGYCKECGKDFLGKLKYNDESLFCIDDACPGFLDNDGYCKECGKDSSGKLKYNVDKNYCAAESCTGVIETNGCCNKCGRTFEEGQDAEAFREEEYRRKEEAKKEPPTNKTCSVCRQSNADWRQTCLFCKTPFPDTNRMGNCCK